MGSAILHIGENTTTDVVVAASSDYQAYRERLVQTESGKVFHKKRGILLKKPEIFTKAYAAVIPIIRL